MRRLLQIALIAASAALILGAGSASASTAKPHATTVAAINICLTADTNFCWHSNGTGAQVTIDNRGGGWMSVYRVNPGTCCGGLGTIQYQNGNGHCLYVNGAKQLIIGANSGCDTTRDDERFVVEPAANGGNFLESYHYGGTYCLVFNDVATRPVWVEPNQTGAWINWRGIAP